MPVAFVNDAITLLRDLVGHQHLDRLTADVLGVAVARSHARGAVTASTTLPATARHERRRRATCQHSSVPTRFRLRGALGRSWPARRAGWRNDESVGANTTSRRRHPSPRSADRDGDRAAATAILRAPRAGSRRSAAHPVHHDRAARARRRTPSSRGPAAVALPPREKREAVLLDRDAGRSIEAVVALGPDERRRVARARATSSRWPSSRELMEAEELVRADPASRRPCAQRGITDFEAIQVDAWPAGHFGRRRSRRPAGSAAASPSSGRAPATASGPTRSTG